MKLRVVGGMLAALVAVLSNNVVAADMAAQVQNGIPYVSGGIGSDETAAMRQVRHDYNLYMTFAIKSGEYQADVDVTIRGRDGVPVATFKAVGPLFYAKLAPGQYKVEAMARGKTQSQTAVLAGSGTHELQFYWDPQ